MRLDKVLSNMGYGSRKDVKVMLKKKRVKVDDKVIKDGSTHVEPDSQCIKVDEHHVHYKNYIYLMMNKLPGYISATEDTREKTVIDLLPAKWQLFNPFPVGRLDKDTEGLLLLTNDGNTAHLLTSPRKNVEKTYYAKINGKVTEEDVVQFKRGIRLDDGYDTKPATLHIISSAALSEIELTITEGKFHQVKRMFAAMGKKVIYLKRIRMGELVLDDNLIPGEVRELTKNECIYLNELKQ
ncbi:pseudouridine synthase [Virgibacillus sp. W0181]|uniref:pseudouridine synthase n=1 Tax=Virgibacillus sp. W0181 TaxID=3391581 RepID=UPI003F48EF2D